MAAVRAQRAGADGDGQLWDIACETVEAAFAADTVVLSVEEFADSSVIRSDPNRTLIPRVDV